MSAKRPLVRFGHSPDADDAFMAWALAEGVVNADDFDVELVAKDIETLNRWSVEEARLEATALSAAAFARVTDKYWLLAHGASFGDGYGPVVVAREAKTLADLAGAHIATPGELTTAYATLRLAAPPFTPRHVRFDRVVDLVLEGKVDAGVVIHEGQLTWERDGLAKVVDLGAWWKDQTGLPLPLGVVALRKDLGAELGGDVNAVLRASLETGLALPRRALAYARGFALAGVTEEETRRFVDMYVNELTVEMGDTGRKAVRELIRRAGEAGIVPRGAKVEMAPE